MSTYWLLRVQKNIIKPREGHLAGLTWFPLEDKHQKEWWIIRVVCDSHHKAEHIPVSGCRMTQPFLYNQKPIVNYRIQIIMLDWFILASIDWIPVWLKMLKYVKTSGWTKSSCECCLCYHFHKVMVASEVKEQASQFLLQKSAGAKYWSGNTGRIVKAHANHLVWQLQLNEALHHGGSCCLSSSCRKFWYVK